MSSLLFWQQLLTIDPYGKRFPDLISRLETSPHLDGSPFLLSHPNLTREDRRKLEKIDPRRVSAAQQSGIRCMKAEDLGIRWRDVGAPPAFFTQGAQPADQPRIAIVGTRTASTYGKAASRKFAEHLASSGITIVSGGAFGVDAAAHEGAMSVGGCTWAVFGTGADKPYPASNMGLYDQVVKQGMIISQYPLGTPSYPNNFVARNHTIAALVDAVVVIEAPEASGALHTSRAAAEMGKDVLVVPGPITLSSFRGSHALIRDGAVLVDHPDQVLEHLGIEPAPPVENEALEGPAGLIFAALKEGPLRLESIAKETGLEPSELLTELTMLEIDGLIIQVPEGYAKK